MSPFNVVICFLMLVGILDVPGVTAAQNLREIARERAQTDPGRPIELPASPGEYWPTTIEEVARGADVVLQAKLSRMKSYLHSSGERVLTDYSIVDVRLIAGRLPVLPTQTSGTAVPLILTVFGGEAIVEGVLIRATDNDREPIKDGGQYLLFLRPSRPPEAGRYEIYYGGIFEILQDNVRPLLKRSDDVFKGTIDARLKDLILRIETAGQVR